MDLDLVLAGHDRAGIVQLQALAGNAAVAAGIRSVQRQADPDIAGLDLAGSALAGAEELRRRQPTVVFTSGRRDVESQARAMASNVVHNRRWIAQTYASVALRNELQSWVDAHPEATTQDAIAAGLAGIMSGWSDGKRAGLSAHFSGYAFDVQPVDAHASEIKAAIRSLPAIKGFLDHEGGLVRWHAQF